MMSFISYLLSGISLGSVYAIIALGYTMVYGIAKMLNFAHGDILMVGGYTAFIAFNQMGLPIPVAVLLSMAVCTALGVLIERIAYKPLRNANSLAVLITAIGVSYLLQNLALLLFSANPKSFTSFVKISPIKLAGGNLTISGETVVTIAVGAIVAVCLLLFIQKTKAGQAMLAVSEDKGAILMLLGLLAPAVVSTVFVLVSGCEDLKRDLKEKIIGFYKVKWMNVFWAVVLYALIIVFSILLSLLFGQSLKQFSFTEDFSFTGVGIGSAFVTITLASIIEEVGWKGYCEDSIGQYMDWFMESLIFGILWSLWHFPLLFIEGTYQAGLMVNPLFVINFFVGAILMGYIITWVYLVSDRSILACMVFHLFVNFMQEKIAMTAETKCVETIVIFIVTAIIVLLNKKMFFGTEHVGRLLKTRFGEGN